MATTYKWTDEIVGVEVKNIVRLKLATSFQQEDIIIKNNKIIIQDRNKRILDEFEVPNAFGPDVPIQQIYEEQLANYCNYLLGGINVNIYAYGYIDRKLLIYSSTGSGKSQTIEGNKKEQGLIMLYASSLFAMLKNKELQSKSDQAQISNYLYSVRIQYVEIIDENITDLFSERKFGEKPEVEDNSWEGPSIKGVKWEKVTNEEVLVEKLLFGMKNKDNTSNEFGKVTASATSYFLIDIKQNYNIRATNEPVLLHSKLSFFDLPGSEILSDDAETIRIRFGSTLHKSIIGFKQLIKDLNNKQLKNPSSYVVYDTSSVTKLSKEILGSNSFTIGIFCLQHGDDKGSGITLAAYKLSLPLKTYPIVNNDKALAILHQFRQEAINAKGFDPSAEGGAGGGVGSVTENLDLKKQINDNLKYISDLDEENSRLAQKLAALRLKYSELVRQKADVQQELIKSEEDKLEVSKALVELEMENARLMDIIQNEKFNQNHKLLNEDIDDLSSNLKEEKARETIKELQERLKEVIDEKREIEMEFMALKKNYLARNQELETEKLRFENYGLELINVMNENKALQEEINQMYKKTGFTSDENRMFVDKIEKLQADVRDKEEAMVFLKAEIERLKTELLRYEMLAQQGRLDIDKKHLEIEKSLVGGNKQPVKEIVKSNDEERMQWESQKMELTHKVKSLQRKVNDDNERIKDLERQMQELSGENNKMQIQLDEMRSIYRNKLIQLSNLQKPTQEIQSREELMRNYTEREQLLLENIEKQKKAEKQFNLEQRSLRSYARNLKYLAEDWAPIGQPLPEILYRDNPLLLKEEDVPMILQKDQENEIERLRNRNRKLENEIQKFQEQAKRQSYIFQLKSFKIFRFKQNAYK